MMAGLCWASAMMVDKKLSLAEDAGMSDQL